MRNFSAELLAPAGDMEKLKVAVAYGADAVYLSGTAFGLRAKAKNFDKIELAEAISYAHKHGSKAYITANIFAHNSHINEMDGYFSLLRDMGADAFIISDPGVMAAALKEAPDVEVHVSTQANITNYRSAIFWHEMGASRIILARELSLEEISEIRQKCPKSLKLEGFVHGAMCMSYSGRCMLSQYMSDRDANLGNCAQPCRYKYRLLAEELSRPGHYMPVREAEEGTEIFSAEDLCMVSHIPDLIEAGLESFKIEGRMKSSFYVGMAVKAYNRAISEALTDEALYQKNIPIYTAMLKMASHRPFSTGFYFAKANSTYEPYKRTHDYIGIVLAYDETIGCALIEQRNAFEIDDMLSFIPPHGESFDMEATKIFDEKGTSLSRVPHAKQRVLLPVSRPVEELTLVCRKL